MRRGSFSLLVLVVVLALTGLQALGKAGEDAAGEGDVAGLNRERGGLGEGLYDGQQRIGGQGRGFIGQRVDDLGAHGDPRKKSRHYIGDFPAL